MGDDGPGGWSATADGDLSFNLDDLDQRRALLLMAKILLEG